MPVLWRLPPTHEQRVFVSTAEGLPITNVILRPSVTWTLPTSVTVHYFLIAHFFLFLRSGFLEGIGPVCRRLKVLYRPKPLRLHRGGWEPLSGCQCVYNHNPILLLPLSFILSKNHNEIHKMGVRASFWLISCYDFTIIYQKIFFVCLLWTVSEVWVIFWCTFVISSISLKSKGMNSTLNFALLFD